MGRRRGCRPESAGHRVLRIRRESEGPDGEAHDPRSALRRLAGPAAAARSPASRAATCRRPRTGRRTASGAMPAPRVASCRQCRRRVWAAASPSRAARRAEASSPPDSAVSQLIRVHVASRRHHESRREVLDHDPPRGVPVAHDRAADGLRRPHRRLNEVLTPHARPGARASGSDGRPRTSPAGQCWRRAGS